MGQPNFLFIMVDQLAAPALAPYGDKMVKAPAIDRLANEGVVFENAYCNFPICGPSRASLHTGKLPFSIGMFDNASEFMASIPTFAHYLRGLGYRVELSGKMHFVGPDQFHGYQSRHTTEIYPANFAWSVDWSKGREFRPTNLTMAPIDIDLINFKMLNNYEKKYLFKYHMDIYSNISKFLSSKEKNWFLSLI